jgi:hypothetical protein
LFKVTKLREFPYSLFEVIIVYYEEDVDYFNIGIVKVISMYTSLP